MDITTYPPTLPFEAVAKRKRISAQRCIERAAGLTAEASCWRRRPLAARSSSAPPKPEPATTRTVDLLRLDFTTVA